MTGFAIRAMLLGIAATGLGVVGTYMLSKDTPEPVTAPRPTCLGSDDLRISGPYTHRNLQVFLLHGKESLPGKQFLTLQEAMEQKKVVVHETGNVNELAIENVSGEDVFVQSGDIVKGGKQDRVFPVDMILTAHSGKTPINSFCVEQGRWQPRGDEKPAIFASSYSMISTKFLKLAAKRSADQSEVWNKVEEMQMGLANNVRGFGAARKGSASPSSVQLAMESRVVVQTVEEYLRALRGSIDGHTDVIGFAFAINGEVNSVDVYASRPLFLKLWPKLLKASAMEAVTAGCKSSEVVVTVEDILSCMEDAESGVSAREQDVGGRTRFLQRETEKNVMFETLDKQNKDAWLHRSYIVREGE